MCQTQIYSTYFVCCEAVNRNGYIEWLLKKAILFSCRAVMLCDSITYAMLCCDRADYSQSWVIHRGLGTQQLLLLSCCAPCRMQSTIMCHICRRRQLYTANVLRSHCSSIVLHTEPAPCCNQIQNSQQCPAPNCAPCKKPCCCSPAVSPPRQMKRGAPRQLCHAEHAACQRRPRHSRWA